MKKVTAKHLMIGDWVKWRNKVTQVYGITPFTNNIALNEHIYDGETQWDYSTTATPIPITEEWLKLNGAKKHSDTFFIYFTKCFMITYGFELGLRVYKYNEMLSYTLDIRYIHQLQQAYRLATGKELKLKF